MTIPASVEHARLSTDGERWKAWGPYLSERQWGTVREDYSPHGNAWEYFPHDHARSRAYRWGEDGIAGFSDREQRLCFALALWNGRDPILKERLFGLTNGEGNHGEDVKELYYYLDATPTHSYLKMLYKYPQGEYPYGRLLEENRRRGIGQPEFELVDSGLFEANRYFDVFVEYAQAEPGDILIQITVENRGPEAASIHLLPQLWFRNTWSWKADAARPVITQSAPGVIRAEHPDLGVYHLHADGQPTELLFCDNESNNHRLWNQPRTAGFFKDGFNDRVVLGDTTVVNPAQCGTKAAPWYTREVRAAGRIQIRLRLCRELRSAAFQDFDRIFTRRLREAD
ncbi:MAG: glucosidase, partial [Gammaproteobacteria bacterium]